MLVAGLVDALVFLGEVVGHHAKSADRAEFDAATGRHVGEGQHAVEVMDGGR